MYIIPRIEILEEQFYIAIKSNLNRVQIPDLLPPLISELFKWLSSRNIDFAGAPFFNYIKIKGEKLEIEVGVPTNSPVDGDDILKAGSFPAVKYAKA